MNIPAVRYKTLRLTSKRQRWSVKTGSTSFQGRMRITIPIRYSILNIHERIPGALRAGVAGFVGLVPVVVVVDVAVVVAVIVDECVV